MPLFDSDFEARVRSCIKSSCNVTPLDMRKVNLPSTEKFIFNSRQTLIHVRNSFVKKGSPSMVVFRCHGLSAHNNQVNQALINNFVILYILIIISFVIVSFINLISHGWIL